MARGARLTAAGLASGLACGLAGLALGGCGTAPHQATAAATSTTGPATSTTGPPTSATGPATSTTTATTTVTTTATTTTTATITLPGAGKPPVTIGDENTPEQFLLGQLYYQALKAQGFPVTLNQSIGPTQVVMQALATGQLAMYPEYLNTWDRQVAGLERSFKTRDDAYIAGERYAIGPGLSLPN